MQRGSDRDSLGRALHLRRAGRTPTFARERALQSQSGTPPATPRRTRNRAGRAAPSAHLEVAPPVVQKALRTFARAAPRDGWQRSFLEQRSQATLGPIGQTPHAP